MTYRHFFSLVIVTLASLVPAALCRSDDMLERNISLPPGFSISIYADNVPNARSMALGPNNILFVGSRKAGNVYAVMDNDHDFIADKVMVIASGLNMPNGVAFRDGDLYVAEVHRIIKFADIEKRLPDPGPPEVVFSDLPHEK